MVEEGEMPHEALIREVQEEVGLDVNVDEIIHEDSNFDESKNTTFTRYVYRCEIYNQNENDIKLDIEEHTEYKLITTLGELRGQKVVDYLIDILSKNNH